MDTTQKRNSGCNKPTINVSREFCLVIDDDVFYAAEAAAGYAKLPTSIPRL